LSFDELTLTKNVHMFKDQRKTILLIDDNALILENLSEYLELVNFRVITANCGAAGLLKANEYLPDLIICDVLMASMNGHEVLKSILAAAATHDIPFIFSTSLSESIDREESLRLGASDYIVKPFEIETLIAMVNRFVGNVCSIPQPFVEYREI